METNTRPKVKLVGEDGNAFAILARCHVAAKEAGWTEDQWKKFHVEATSGDYNNLLCIVLNYFDDVDDEEDDF